MVEAVLGGADLVGVALDPDGLVVHGLEDLDVLGEHSRSRLHGVAGHIPRRTRVACRESDFHGVIDLVQMNAHYWEGEMGVALHRRFAFVDVACSGEAEESFPALLHALASGAPLDEVSGIVHRDGAGTRATPANSFDPSISAAGGFCGLGG